MVRPDGFEPPTNWFEASYSIHLSYERTMRHPEEVPEMLLHSGVASAKGACLPTGRDQPSAEAELTARERVIIREKAMTVN